MAIADPPVTPTPDLMPAPPGSTKPRTRMERLQEFFLRYGVLGVVVNYVIFGLCMLVIFVLIRAGVHLVEVDPAAKSTFWGTLAAAYIVCKIIQIPRLAVTFAITPLIARLMDRMRKKKQE